MFLDPGCYNTLIKKWVSISVDRINYETYMSIVGACLHQNNVGKFENRYPLLNILVSLHVGMLNPIHASLKLVFQPPSFIDQSLQPLSFIDHGI